MPDTRELILARLLFIGQSMIGAPHNVFKSAYRNRGLVENENRPAFVLLDGPENARTTGERRGRGGASGFSPQVMVMRPEIYLLTGEMRPLNSAPNGANNIGELLNSWRFSLLSLIEMDTALHNLIGDNGEIVLSGTDVDMSSRTPGVGEMRLDFSIAYVLDPT